MKSLTRSLLLALALTTGAWVPVQAQTFGQSFAAFERKDYRTAFAGFKKQAEQGNAPAQFMLGNMYAKGRGVPKDDQQAVAWYRKAAEQGDADAQYNLGVRYAGGQGVSKDEQSAYFWLLLASAQGDQNVVKARDIVERGLSPEQRAAAQASAHNWKPKTAAQSSKVPREDKWGQR
jgi:TPR repeat protein